MISQKFKKLFVKLHRSMCEATENFVNQFNITETVEKFGITGGF
jgi:hypothetical protein